MSHFFKLAARFFVYLALVAPIIIATNLFFPFINGKVLLFRTSIELALLCLIIHLITSQHWTVKNFFTNPIVIAVSVFGIVFTVTSLLGIRPAASFWSNFERGEGAFQVLHYITFFLLATYLFDTANQWRRLLGFSVIASVVVSAYGFLQWLQNWGWHNFAIATGRVSGTLGNPSYLSGYLLFHIFFSFWLWYVEKTRWRWAWLAICIGELLLFFTTRTLAAIFGLLVAVLIGVIMYGYRAYRRHSTDTADPKKTLLISYLSSFLIIAVVGGLSYYILTNQQALYDRLKPRLWSWGSAWQGVKERPLLGWGAESFPAVFDKYYNANHFGGESWFDRTHNIFLEYLISGGIVLLLAHLAIFFLYYWRLWRGRRDDWLWPALFVLPIAYFIQGLTLFDILPIFIALFLFLAWFVNYSADFSHHTEPAPLRRWFVWQGVAGAVVSVALIGVWYWGTYLPLQKNLALANGLRSSNINEAITRAMATLEQPSPIGQQETYESLGRNLVIFLEGAAQKNEKVDSKNPTFQAIMAINETWFPRIQPRLLGIKDYYLNGIWNFDAYRVSGDMQYARKAKNILLEARQQAPDRMELLLALLDIARLEKDQTAITDLLTRIRQLRPDVAARFGG